VIIGVLHEALPGETRVSATPATVEKLIELGYSVVIEPGAGAASSVSDDSSIAAGATIGDAATADIIFGINAPSVAQLDRLREGTTVISLVSPALNPDLVADLARRRITALAMDAVPRISRAQSLDVLSSMANIAGYRAVIEAANAFGRFFTGQITAAGKVPPAKVLVAGVGVAGLAAIGTAGGMGAIVYATDPRPEVADQVSSLGGKYLEVAAADVEVSSTGYAKEMSDDYNARAAALYAKWAPEIDIIITTALIPGRAAPILITAEMVASMKRGSVIVDMAASNGGNVEGTVKGEVVVTANGVTIIGYTDLPGRLAAQASQLFSTNLVNLLKLMTPGKDGVLVIDWDDVVQRGITVARDGEVTWPPPAVQVSAAPTQAVAEQVIAEVPVKAPMSAARRFTYVGIGAAILLLLVAASPPSFRVHLTVFVLAIVIGYYVIGSVHHALHTPLMSVTNAISGIIVVGALLQIGHGNTAITVLAFVAVLLASINVFGGFAVTRRMLSMFSRS
jgi:NAD(P) transhydrogenase subunit alpha